MLPPDGLVAGSKHGARQWATAAFCRQGDRIERAIVAWEDFGFLRDLRKRCASVRNDSLEVARELLDRPVEPMKPRRIQGGPSPALGVAIAISGGA